MVKKKNTFDPAILKDFPFFAPFSSEQLQGIFSEAQSATLRAGQVVLKQGEGAGAIYLILKGGIKIESSDSAGMVYMLGEMGKGQVFGELALLQHDPSRVTVTTTMDSVVLPITRAMVLNMMRSVDHEQVLDVFLALNEHTRAATERGFREVLAKRVLVSQMEAEKQLALTQMVASVAHEVNTPLSVINMAVSIMARELAEPVEVTFKRAADIAESLELMRLNVERADYLMQNFKQILVSQLKDEKELFDISEAIEATVGLVHVSLKHGRVQVKFHNKLAPEQKVWMGCRGFLSQVLINLLMNVERYAYPNGTGGIVDVTIELCDDEHYYLTVKDYGMGIPKEDREHIFEPLFTTGKSLGGTGLGLAIVHNLVTNAMGGQIKLNSEVGKGTEFIVILPRVVLE
jgi:signal transduction histidine kinase